MNAIILGYQNKPAAQTAESIYTVPTGRRARVKVICVNDSGNADTVRVWHRIAGAAQDDDLNLILPDIDVGTKNNTEVVGGNQYLLLNEGDIIDVLSDGGDVIFHLNGYEDDIPTG